MHAKEESRVEISSLLYGRYNVDIVPNPLLPFLSPRVPKVPHGPRKRRRSLHLRPKARLRQPSIHHLHHFRPCQHLRYHRKAPHNRPPSLPLLHSQAHPEQPHNCADVVPNRSRIPLVQRLPTLFPFQDAGGNTKGIFGLDAGLYDYSGV